MAEAQLQRFLEKVRQLNAFVAMSQARPELLRALRDCDDHHQVVALARSCGFEIGRRWGESDGDRCGTDNLLDSICPAAGSETTTVLLRSARLRLERIHSCAATSPEGFWYEQPQQEWVLLLQGSAAVHFADESEPRRLRCGDTLLITPRRRHRVTATDPAPGSIWLALFWEEPDAG